jgi:hypothetical protein
MLKELKVEIRAANLGWVAEGLGHPDLGQRERH